MRKRRETEHANNEGRQMSPSQKGQQKARENPEKATGTNQTSNKEGTDNMEYTINTIPKRAPSLDEAEFVALMSWIEKPSMTIEGLGIDGKKILRSQIKYGLKIAQDFSDEMTRADAVNRELNAAKKRAIFAENRQTELQAALNDMAQRAKHAEAVAVDFESKGRDLEHRARKMETDLLAQINTLQNTAQERESAFEHAARESSARIAQLEAQVAQQHKALYGNPEVVLNDELLPKTDD